MARHSPPKSKFTIQVADRLVRRLKKTHRVCTYETANELGVHPKTVRESLRHLRDLGVEVFYLDRDHCWHTCPDYDEEWDLISVRRVRELGLLAPHEERRLELALNSRGPEPNPGRPMLVVVALRGRPRLTAAEQQRLKMKLTAC